MQPAITPCSAKNTWLAIILAAMLALMNFFAFYIFPPNEGWWQSYAYLISKGQVPYKDFNLAFPPLFVYFNYLQLTLSDYFAIYRLVGIAEVLVVFLLLTKLLTNFYSRKISLVAAFVGVTLMMNIYLFIPNDYHVFANLFTLAGLTLYLEFSKETATGKRLLYLYATALLLSSLLLTKQNIGALLIVAVLATLLYGDFPNRTRYVVHYLVALALFFLGQSALMHLSPDQFVALTLKNDAKGSVNSILFNFIFNELNRKYFILAVTLTLLYFLLRRRLRNPIHQWPFLILGAVTVLTLIFTHQSPLITLLIVGTISFLLIEFSKQKKSKLKYGLPFIFLCLIYANTFTSDITMMYLFPAAAFLVAEILSLIESNFSQKIFVTSCVFLATMFFVAHLRDKFYFPYEWWGTQSSVSQATYRLPYDELKFISVDKSTSIFFTAVKSAIDTYSHGDDIYLFPRIPIFYELHNKLPITQNPVQWFDVISQRNMEDELRKIKQAQPALVIMLTSSAAAYAIHEKLKHQPQIQSMVADYFDSEVSKGKYQLLNYQILNNDIFSSPESSSGRLTITFKVVNPAIFGNTIADIGALPKDISVIKVITHQGDLYYLETLRYKLEPFDQIVLQSQAAHVEQIARLIGPPEEKKDFFNALKIYRRTEHGDTSK